MLKLTASADNEPIYIQYKSIESLTEWDNPTNGHETIIGLRSGDTESVKESAEAIARYIATKSSYNGLPNIDTINEINVDKFEFEDFDEILYYAQKGILKTIDDQKEKGHEHLEHLEELIERIKKYEDTLITVTFRETV